MGLSYAFELVAELSSAERLIRAISEQLVPDDRERVTDALQRATPGESANICRTELERSIFEKGGDAHCFCFQFVPDNPLLKYSEDSAIRRRVDDGLIPVGCVWTSFQRGVRFILIRATAATTGMSRLFKNSESIRKTFRDIGRSGGAIVVFLDDEEAGAFIGAWPPPNQVRVEEAKAAPAYSGNTFDVDRYCTDLISAGDAEADVTAQLARTVWEYEQGMLGEGTVRAKVIEYAGRSSAGLVVSALTPEIRELVAQDGLVVNPPISPDQIVVVESVCNIPGPSAEEQEQRNRNRREWAFRGAWALHRELRGKSR